MTRPHPRSKSRATASGGYRNLHESQSISAPLVGVVPRHLPTGWSSKEDHWRIIVGQALAEAIGLDNRTLNDSISPAN